MSEFLSVMACRCWPACSLSSVQPSLGSTCWPGGSFSWTWPWPRSRRWRQRGLFAGAEPHDPSTYFWSFASPSLGAAPSPSFGTGKPLGPAGGFSSAISFSWPRCPLLLLQIRPHGAEHVQGVLMSEAWAGSVPRTLPSWRRSMPWSGFFLWRRHKVLLLCSKTRGSERQGHSCALVGILL